MHEIKIKQNFPFHKNIIFLRSLQRVKKKIINLLLLRTAYSHYTMYCHF